MIILVMLVLVIFVPIALMDVPRLIRSKEWRILGVYSALYALGLTMAFCLITHVVDLPSVIVMIYHLLQRLHITYPVPS